MGKSNDFPRTYATQAPVTTISFPISVQQMKELAHDEVRAMTVGNSA